MLAKVAGRIRGFFAGNYPENDETNQFAMNNRGDQVVAQGLPELTELIRLGNSYQAITSAGQAALTGLPTTTAGASINNDEKAMGLCYAIDSFGSYEAVVDATQTDPTSIFAMLNRAASAQASGGTTEAISQMVSLSGRKNYGGSGVFIRGGTVANDVWFPHNSPSQMAAAQLGAIWKVNECPVRGLYLVPPGCTFSIQAVKTAGAAAQQFFFIRWHEVQLIYKT